MKSTLRVLLCALLVSAFPAFAQQTASETRIGALEQFNAWRHALTSSGYALSVNNGFESKNDEANEKMFKGWGDDLTFSYIANLKSNLFSATTTYHYGQKPGEKKNNFADNIEVGYGRAIKSKTKDGYDLVAGIAATIYFDEERAEECASVRLMPAITFAKDFKNKFSLGGKVKFPYYFKHGNPKTGKAFATSIEVTPAYNFSDKFAVELGTEFKNVIAYGAQKTDSKHYHKHYVAQFDLQLGVRYSLSKSVNFAPYVKSEKVFAINQAAQHNAFTKPVVGFNLIAKLF